MKVLVTGGAGFVGSNLVDILLADNHDVFVIDNYETGRKDNLTDHKNLTMVENTICNEGVMKEVFSDFKPEVVVHAAASYKDPDNYIGDAATNAHGSAVVVENANRVGTKRLLYLQTALCYGEPDEQPIKIDHPLKIDSTSYAISKTAGELYCRMFKGDHLTFRLANAYGPRNISGPLPTFWKRLKEGKTCFCADTRRDFIFIDDLTKILNLAVHGKGKTGAYHVSSGGDQSIKELFDEVIKTMSIKLDKEVEIRPRDPDDAATILLDPSKTQQDFGFTPNTSLEVGVPKTIDYYEKFGIEQTFTHLKHDGN